MKKTLRLMVALLVGTVATLSAQAADYATYITAARGFTEVTTLDGIWGDAAYYYLLAPAESNEFIVGVGNYEAKPGWAGDDTKALRYHSVATDPVLDMSNFFTIEKSGQYIGLRNVVYDTDLFQTHDNAGYMYVNTFTDKTLDEWSYLIPHWQNDGYWLFENGKYPASNTEGWRGYMGSWTAGRMAVDEPIALNRLNTDGDPAGHYRLFRIAKTDLMAQRLYATVLTAANGFTEVTTTDALSDDPQYVYLITSADQPSLFVGVGRYQDKPSWAGDDTKALRYRQAGNPVADLSNFFTIEKSGQYIGLRNMVYHTSLFQTHNDQGFLYVFTNTEPTMSDWCYLKPTFQSGYWMFENGKYPASSSAQWRGYMGPWTANHFADDEPIALNRLNTTGDEAGHYRLWRISRTNLFALMQGVASGSAADMTWKVTNPSFELGETGWTLNDREKDNEEYKSRNYGMTGKAGTYLLNAYQWWATSLDVAQTVEHLPSGQYELSATVASWAGRTVTLQANAAKVTASGVHADGGVKVKATVNIGPEGRLAIKIGSATDWWSEGVTHGDDDNKCFFKLDDVQLHCQSLFLDALAIRLPNNETPLVPGQWYYFETNYSTEFQLIGPYADFVYTTDGQVQASSSSLNSATSTLTLPVGRTYFKTNASNATLQITPKNSVLEGTFTCVALNVDGLPNTLNYGVGSYDLNPDGPGRDGTLKISQYLASKGYDFIGCSEDFNYNGALMESLSGYSCGTVRNTLSVSGLDYLDLLKGKIHVETDGLNLLWKDSKILATNESWTRWWDTASTEGNEYVEKGYRHYDVQIDGGAALIDVFILHMDAGDTDATWSRESQWRQLAEAINGSDHNRAKLIIGDTNSRYTREDVITNFINRLSSDFTMGDVWVEMYRDGIYPTTDMANLTDASNPDNYTNYEIVDKIIYINPTTANTVRLTPQTFSIQYDYTYDYVDHNGNTTPLGDHRPVVVTFKYQLSGEVLPTAISLADASDNTALIGYANDVLANVTLQGRTLYKDGSWNTICLPFPMTAEQVTAQLAPTALMELDTDGTYDGHKTGLDGTKLYLNFKNASDIRAGVPYIIKWDSGTNLANPVFRGVTMTSGIPAGITSQDNAVTFQGTYAPATLTAAPTNLYLAADNGLYYPKADGFKVNAFRAYFQVPSNSSARQFVLNFGDGETTGISLATAPSVKGGRSGYYTIHGVKLDKLPTRKGLYIIDGQIVVK